MSDSGTERGDPVPIELRGVLPAGTLLRGYELKAILGQGAFGITYRALDNTLHRDVAIKEYLPTTLALREGRTTVLPRSPEHAQQFAWGRERFLDEARILARLDRTSSIIRVFDFLEANGTAYMVMALVEGETLHKRLMREQRLTPEAVERIVFPLLDGLEEVHAATFLHRDIKPANIMLDARGQPTLIDFGASRAAMAERSTTMTAIFTPGYASAEQFVASSKLGPWTDIYGLSATLYHAITGRIPPSAVERILNDEYEPLSKLRPAGFSPDLLAGIDAGMAIRAADRPQSIAEWRGLLGRPAADEAGAATRMARPPRRLRGAGRIDALRRAVRKPAAWGALAAALVLIAGGGYFAWIANAPGPVTSAALNLSAEQLEQALAERRKADALAAEKKQLVEEAQRKADADAEANRRAEAELRDARAARQKAEEELAKLKADFEARRQSDTPKQDQTDIAARRAAEEAARLKSEAEAAKLKADDELRLKAEAAAAAAKEKGDLEAQKKVAEAAETALRLEPRDRQRLQVALTSLGFDTRGSDGVVGPRSREMIAAWQKARNQPVTGFLNGTQHQALLKEAAPALGKYDEEDRKKIEEEVRRMAPAPPPSASAPTSADGLWRGTYACQGGGPFTLNLEIRVTNGFGRWTSENWSNANDNTVAIRMSIDGNNATVSRGRVTGGSVNSPSITGKLDGNEIRANGREAGTANTCTLSLARMPEAAPSAGAYDGVYTGSPANAGGVLPYRSARLEIVNGRGNGTISVTGTCNGSFTIVLSSTGTPKGEGIECTTGRPYTVTGGFEGSRLILQLPTSGGAGLARYILARQGN